MTASVEERASAPRSATTALSLLRRGQCALIISLSAAHGEPLARRLADLGLEPGREIEVHRRAPMGDPTVYRVAGYEISLRKREASLVMVDVLDPTTHRPT